MSFKKLLSVMMAVIMIVLAVPAVEANAATSGYYTYKIVDGGAVITDVDTSISGDVVIPDTLGGYPVREIGALAFRNGYKIISNTIPHSVTNIEYEALRYLERLESIFVSDENFNYQSINGVLFSKDGKDLVRFPAGRTGQYIIPNHVTTINDFAFERTNLSDIVIPDSVISIGYSAFFCSRNLASISIPDSVTNMDSALAYSDVNEINVSLNNEAYRSINGVLFNKSGTKLIQYPLGNTSEIYAIPDGVTHIGVCAFVCCEKIKSIAIPESVESIGNGAFALCNNLTNITIPNCVTSIEENAFSSCYNLTDVYYTGSESDWANIDIGTNNECLTGATIHYNYVVEDTDDPDDKEDNESEENDQNYFIIGRDSNSFEHDLADFGYKFNRTECSLYTEYSMGSVYPTSEAYYNRLISGMDKGEKDKFRKIMDTGTWGGSCHGLSLSMLFANTGKMNVKDFYIEEDQIYEPSELQCYNDLYFPGHDLNLRDYINYCHLLQYTDLVSYETVLNLSFFNDSLFVTMGWIDFWLDLTKKVEIAVEEQEPVLLSLYYGDGLGHSVLICGYDDSDWTDLVFQIYNCNDLDSYVYMHINPYRTGDFYFTDEQGHEYTNFFITKDDWNGFKYWDVSNVDSSVEIWESTDKTHKSSMNYSPESTSYDSTKYVEFTVDGGKEFTLTASDGDYLEFDGSSYSGDMEVNNVNFIGDTEYQMCFTIEKSDEYVISIVDDGCEFSICGDDTYYVASADNADAIVFKSGDGIYIEGADYTFYGGMSLASDVGLVYISGECSDNSKFTAYGDNINIESNGTFDSVNISIITEEGKIHVETPDEFSAVEIDTVNNEAVIPELTTPGDANTDGKVNMFDASAILKHIAGWNVTVDSDAADVTADGKVNLMDVSLLLQYIAGWDVVLK